MTTEYVVLPWLQLTDLKTIGDVVFLPLALVDRSNVRINAIRDSAARVFVERTGQPVDVTVCQPRLGDVSPDYATQQMQSAIYCLTLAASLLNCPYALPREDVDSTVFEFGPFSMPRSDGLVGIPAENRYGDLQLKLVTSEFVKIQRPEWCGILPAGQDIDLTLAAALYDKVIGGDERMAEALRYFHVAFSNSPFVPRETKFAILSAAFEKLVGKPASDRITKLFAPFQLPLLASHDCNSFAAVRRNLAERRNAYVHPDPGFRLVPGIKDDPRPYVYDKCFAGVVLAWLVNGTPTLRSSFATIIEQLDRWFRNESRKCCSRCIGSNDTMIELIDESERNLRS